MKEFLIFVKPNSKYSMKISNLLYLFLSVLNAFGQKSDSFLPDFEAAKPIAGMKLIWQDEFNENGKPNPKFWKFEKGFVRNEELQWYQEENANCQNGVLLIPCISK